jgi:hypothetical protein
MNRRFWVYILLLIFIIPSKVEAQRWKLKRYEASFGVGTSHPFMDIGNNNDGLRSFQLAGTRPAATIGARYKLLQDVSAGIDLSYIMFGGIDVDGGLTVHSFTSNTFEPVATLQYNIVSEGRTFGSTSLFNRRGMVNNYNSADFYIFAGMGGILSKASAKDVNGQIDNDAAFFDNNMHYGIVFPVGVGFKYSVDAYWNFGVEVGGRFSLTDNLDGYATPYSEYNDRYITTSFKAIYKIRNDRRGVPIFNKYGR